MIQKAFEGFGISDLDTDEVLEEIRDTKEIDACRPDDVSEENLQMTSFIDAEGNFIPVDELEG